MVGEGGGGGGAGSDWIRVDMFAPVKKFGRASTDIFIDKRGGDFM